MKFDQTKVDMLNVEMGNSSPEQVIEWTLDNLHPDVALASSFGAEDVVVIDLLMKVNPEARIFTLDTGRLNQETYDVIDSIREKYNTEIEVMFPDQEEVEEMVRNFGMNLFYKNRENRKLCCGVRKVRPLKKMLSTLDGWITGIRADQTKNRNGAAKFELDRQFGGILKVNPIINWTWEQVWNYIEENKVPYNELHDKGYPSIGCRPCTRVVRAGEDLRAGRWWWENESDKECGLHMNHEKSHLKVA